jgi:hypothetical protein
MCIAEVPYLLISGFKSASNEGLLHWFFVFSLKHTFSVWKLTYVPETYCSADRWGLERLTVEVLCPLVAPDSPVTHRTVRCVLTSALCTVHRSRLLGAVDRCSVGSPDMSGAHRTVRWIIAEWLWEKPESGQFVGALAWAPDSVRCATGITNASICSKLCRVLQLILFVGLCCTLCTWDKWQLGKLVSPRGLWWTSNTKIDYSKCLSLFPFQNN